MAILAPWKGYLRVVMPIISFLILSNAAIILTLSIFNAATLDLHADDIGEEIRQNAPRITAQLVFFWCTIPFLLVVAAACETYALYSNNLRPLVCLVTSTTSVGIWVAQLALWQICLSTLTTYDKGFCPVPEIWSEHYPGWNLASPQGAAWAVLPIFICYLVKIGFAASVFKRQRRTSFRKSDLRGSWALKLEVEELRSEVRSTRTASVQHNLLVEERESERTSRVASAEHNLLAGHHESGRTTRSASAATVKHNFLAEEPWRERYSFEDVRFSDDLSSMGHESY